MISKRYKLFLVLLSCNFLTKSCEDFVEVEPPNHKMVTETVFASDETAIAAVNGIYNELHTSANFANGSTSSVTVLSGMSSDIFDTTSATDMRYGPFSQNELSPGETPDAAANYELWSSAYSILYMANSILEGVAASDGISESVNKTIEGQVRFIRAFTFFYLTYLYGDVPLILSTDYRLNMVAGRDDSEKVMEQIMIDLEMALYLLEDKVDYPELERTQINLHVVKSFMARVHLYEQNWKKAEDLSTDVISQSSLYNVLEDPSQVFLKNSREAIWQISPVLSGFGFSFTKEGYFFRGQNSSPVKLADDFVSSMVFTDKRFTEWMGYNENRDFYYPKKYKDGNSRNNVTEYSMVLRLAEQYLIRAEALTMQGNLGGAITDIDIIRSRAGLDLIVESNPSISQQALLDTIMIARKRELFAEWGHRWLDLKRTGTASAVLTPIKYQWEPTDVYYPIPNEEREKNPNLGQNNGY